MEVEGHQSPVSTFSMLMHQTWGNVQTSYGMRGILIQEWFFAGTAIQAMYALAAMSVPLLCYASGSLGQRLFLFCLHLSLLSLCACQRH